MEIYWRCIGDMIFAKIRINFELYKKECRKKRKKVKNYFESRKIERP